MTKLEKWSIILNVNVKATKSRSLLVYMNKYKEDTIMEEKEVILTQEGFDRLEKELELLRTEKRAEIAERIKVALGFWDLSENSEYDEAKNAQAENEAKIAELENKKELK